jgi:hypothetical protein
MPPFRGHFLFPGQSIPCRINAWQQHSPPNQPNRLACGGARVSGNRAVTVVGAFSARQVSIFLIISGSSMQAITLAAPPQARQVFTSMLNTRLSRCAQLMAAWRSVGVRSCGSLAVVDLQPVPRPAAYGARNGTSTFKPVRRKYSPTAQLPWFEDAGYPSMEESVYAEYMEHFSLRCLFYNPYRIQRWTRHR